MSKLRSRAAGRVATGLIAALLGSVLTATIILAVSPPDPGPFTGCLATTNHGSLHVSKGQIYNVASSATTPSAPCGAGDSTIGFGQGAKGDPGPSGAPGPSGVPGLPGTGATAGYTYVGANRTTLPYGAFGTPASVELPAGSYIVNVAGSVANPDNAATLVECELNAPENGTVSTGSLTVDTGVHGTLAMTGAVLLGHTQDVTVDCLVGTFGSVGQPVVFDDMHMTAVAVDPLTETVGSPSP